MSLASCHDGAPDGVDVMDSPPVSTPAAAAQGVPAPTLPASSPPAVAGASPVPGPVEDAPACGVDPQATEITGHIAQVPGPSLSGMHWDYDGDSNYDPCAALSYATVVQSRIGDAQFQNQLMLFHDGEYIGVGSDSVQQHRIVSTTDDTVTVSYKDYDALAASGEPFAAAPRYTTEVTYRWTDKGVVPDGRFPNLDRQTDVAM